jgi:uncharacterized membrane protein
MADEELKNEDKLLSGLAYPIPLIALIMIFTDKKNIPFCRYHAWQALFFGLAFFAFSLVSMILDFIPGVGCIMGIVHFVVVLAWLVVAIIYCLQTLKGERVEIPYITEFAKKYSEQ